MQDRIKKLEAEIEKARKQIQDIKEKRKVEIGKLAMKAGIDEFDNEFLLQQFEDIAKNFNHSKSTETQKEDEAITA